MARAAKPQSPALNPGHSLARGLLLCSSFDSSSSSLVADHSPHRRHGTSSGAVHGGLGRTGKVLEFDGTADNVNYGSGDWLPTDSCTIAVLFRKTDLTGRNSRLFTYDSAVSSIDVSAFVPGSAGNTGWSFGGFSVGTSRIMVAATPSDYATETLMVFTVGSKGMEIWQDGILIASQVGHATRTASSLNWGPGNRSGYADLVQYSLFAVWDRQIDPSEIRALSVDPFDMLRPPAAAAEAATGSSGTASGTIPMMTADASGTVFTEITGTATGTIPLMTMAASGSSITEVTGTATGEIPVPTVVASGSVVSGGAVTGSAATSIPLLTADASGTVTTAITGTATGSIPMMTMAASGSAVTAITGTATGTIPVMTSAASGAVGTGAVFDGMTLSVSLAGSPNFFDDMRLLHEDSTWVVYDKYWITGGAAFLIGARVNKSTNDYTLVIWLNYGHQNWNVDKPEQVFVSVTLTWDSGGGSIGPIIVDDPPNGGIVESGQTIPPTIIKWNGTTKTQTDLYEGRFNAFVKQGPWIPYPGAPNSSLQRFTFRYDPGRSQSDYDLLIPGMMYGGTWLGSDGQRIRPDLLEFHSADYGSWYQAGKTVAQNGTGWWLTDRLNTSGLRKTAGEGWWFMPGGQHCDNGVGLVTRSFYHGGEEFWTDPVYHFYVIQMAARYLNHHPAPGPGYASIYRNRYYNFAMRQQGRIIGHGVWVWRCLLRLSEWSDDPQVAEMLAAIGPRVIEIFQDIWHDSKPYALPGEDPPTRGYWHRFASVSGHPEMNNGGPQFLLDYQPYQGGILWQGLYHLWEALGEFGLSSGIDFARVRILMDFVALGYGDVEGVWDLLFKWKSSHPYPPPDPLPPPWAKGPACTGGTSFAGCWPQPQTYTLGGHGWGHEYYHYLGNSNNDDLRYLSGPSTGTFNQQYPLIDFLYQVAGISTPKMMELQADMEGSSYQMRLGNRLRKSGADSFTFTEESGVYTSSVVGLQLMVDASDSISITEESGTNQGGNTLIRAASDTIMMLGDDSIRRKKIRRTANEPITFTEMAWRGGGSMRALYRGGDDTVTIGEGEGQLEGVFVLSSPVNVNEAIFGVSTSVGATIYSD